VGKGTQAARISVHYGVPTISTGAMFREAVARGTALGRIIQRYRIDRGEYVPDDVVVAAVEERIKEPDCVSGFLLDGFPRTVPQAERLDAMLAERDLKVNGALAFEAPIEELVERFGGRRVCPVDGSTYHIVNQPPIQPGLCDICHTRLIVREDDKPDVVRRRMEIYTEKTAPLMEFYRAKGLLRVIDATPEPETIFGRVVEVLDQLK
jgi:adenylate kinase